MKTLLLILTTTKDTPKAVDYAFKQAREQKARLEAFFVLDAKLPQSVIRKLTQEGFIGDTPSSDLAESLLEEYEQRGVRRLESIKERARREGVELHTSLRRGDVAEVCLAFIEEQKPQEVILPHMKQSRLSRFIFSSAVDKIQSGSTCPVTIVEELEKG